MTNIEEKQLSELLREAIQLPNMIKVSWVDLMLKAADELDTHNSRIVELDNLHSNYSELLGKNEFLTLEVVDLSFSLKSVCSELEFHLSREPTNSDDRQRIIRSQLVLNESREILKKYSV